MSVRKPKLVGVDKHAIFLTLVIIGFLAFELFNFDSSRQGLESLFGNLFTFGIPGFSLATILALAACAIDLGGLASIFTDEDIKSEPIWVWALGIAWFLAAMINAGLTWWVLTRGMTGGDLANPFFSPDQMLKFVPLAMALFVLLIRVSLIGSLVTMFAGGQKKAPGISIPRTGPTKSMPTRPKSTNAPIPKEIENIIKEIG